MRKTIFILLIIGFCFGQEHIPVDTLLYNQKKMLGNQKKILDEVTYTDPLEGKRYGIEFNPARFLVSSTDDDGLVITGGLSLFSVSKSAEIAFPIYYAVGGYDSKVFHLDSHYRNFLGKHRNGFYISTGIRFTILEGREGNYTWELSDKTSSTSRMGLTFGIGYRIFGKNGWYWGTSLFAGRYFKEVKYSLMNVGSAGNEVIIDMELLKIGRLF